MSRLGPVSDYQACTHATDMPQRAILSKVLDAIYLAKACRVVDAKHRLIPPAVLSLPSLLSHAAHQDQTRRESAAVVSDETCVGKSQKRRNGARTPGDYSQKLPARFSGAPFPRPQGAHLLRLLTSGRSRVILAAEKKSTLGKSHPCSGEEVYDRQDAEVCRRVPGVEATC